MKAPRHVLMIDDDQEIVAGTSLRLRAAGYDVASASNGELGIAAAKSLHPDAIILDVKMPRMSGLVALQCLKGNAATSDIPVVVLSASLGDQRAALDGGAQFYLRKPYKPQSLLSALDAAIDGEADKSNSQQRDKMPLTVDAASCRVVCQEPRNDRN